MDLKTMEYFLAVIEEGSISRGAQRLNLSQPPLTVRLRALEKELGVALLTRSGRGVEPTAAGRLFADRVRRLLSELDSAEDAVRSVGHGVSGSLRIGVSHSVAPLTLAELLGELHDQAPELEITLRESDESPMQSRISDGELDCAVLHTPRLTSGVGRPPSIEAAVAKREPLVVVLRSDQAAARSERADLVSLTAGDLVTPSRASSSTLFKHNLEVWTSSGGDPTRVREAASPGVAQSLVAAGHGITLLPKSAAAGLLPQLCARPLLQHHPPLELSILWRVDASSPVLHRFLRIALATPEPDVLGPEHARPGSPVRGDPTRRL